MVRIRSVEDGLSAFLKQFDLFITLIRLKLLQIFFNDTSSNLALKSPMKSRRSYFDIHRLVPCVKQSYVFLLALFGGSKSMKLPILFYCANLFLRENLQSSVLPFFLRENICRNVLKNMKKANLLVQIF